MTASPTGLARLADATAIAARPPSLQRLLDIARWGSGIATTSVFIGDFGSPEYRQASFATGDPGKPRNRAFRGRLRFTMFGGETVPVSRLAQSR